VVSPVVVGGGIPFYPQRERRLDLELVETSHKRARQARLRKMHHAQLRLRGSRWTRHG
jgi:hypothetical protein